MFSRVTPFRTLPIPNADDALCALRPPARAGEAGGPFCLAVLNRVPRLSLGRRAGSRDVFRRLGAELFFRRGASPPPDAGPGLPEGVQCAWFHGSAPIDAVIAATEFQNAWMRHRATPCAVVVAPTEYAAVTLLGLAGPDQVLVDPDYWGTLEPREQDLVRASNVHPPDLSARAAASAECVRSAVQGVFGRPGGRWWRRPPHPSSPMPSLNGART